MPLAEITSMVQEEASRPQFTPTGSNTSPQEAMHCDHRILDKRRPQQYAFRLKLSPHQLKTNKNQSGRPEKIDKSTNSAKTDSHRRSHARHDRMGCWSARKAQRLNKRLILGRGRRINFPLVFPSICLRDMGKTKLIREATCEGHLSCCLRGLTIMKHGMYSQYS